MADAQTRPCASCEGSGEEFDRNAEGGYVRDCPDCHGTGSVPYRGSRPAPTPPPPPAPAPAPPLATPSPAAGATSAPWPPPFTPQVS